MQQVRDAVLPVCHDGQLQIVSWGSRSGRLPRSGYTWLSTLAAGEWAAYAADEVVIPATVGLHMVFGTQSGKACAASWLSAGGIERRT